MIDNKIIQCKCCGSPHSECFIKDGLCYNCNKYLKQQLEEKDREIERLKKNHRISYTNQKRIYEKLKNSINTKSLIKYPLRLDGCLIKNEQDLFDYAKESTKDIIYLRNERTKLVITELEKLRKNILINQKGDDGWTSLEVDLQYLVDMINEQIEKLEGE